MSDAIKKGDWVVDHTTTREGDLRIIAGHYPFAIRDHIGDILALVKSRSEARLGFTKASTLDERDEGWKIATLMAAAPEMHEALSDCLALLVNGEDGCDDTPERVIDATRKALRQAKPN